MGPEKIIEAWMRKVVDQVQPKELRQEITAGLQYLRRQIATDLDRRDRHAALVDGWRALERKLTDTPLIQEFRQSQELVAVADRLGIRNEIRPIDQFEKWEVGELFKDVLRRLPENKLLTDRDRLFIESSLRYLIVESERARHLRDLAAVKKTWRTVQPILSKAGLMYLYRGSAMLRQRLEFFIRGGFV